MKVEQLDLSRGEDRLLMMCIAIKCADISNVCKPSSVYHGWTDRLIQEVRFHFVFSFILFFNHNIIFQLKFNCFVLFFLFSSFMHKEIKRKTWQSLFRLSWTDKNLKLVRFLFFSFPFVSFVCYFVILFALLFSCTLKLSTVAKSQRGFFQFVAEPLLNPFLHYLGGPGAEILSIFKDNMLSWNSY